MNDLPSESLIALGLSQSTISTWRKNGVSNHGKIILKLLCENDSLREQLVLARITIKGLANELSQ